MCAGDGEIVRLSWWLWMVALNWEFTARGRSATVGLATVGLATAGWCHDGRLVPRRQAGATTAVSYGTTKSMEPNALAAVCQRTVLQIAKLSAVFSCMTLLDACFLSLSFTWAPIVGPFHSFISPVG